MDTPTLADFLEVLLNGNDNGIAVLHDGSQFGVRNLITNDGRGLLLQIGVGSPWSVGRNIRTEVGVSLEGTIFLFIDSPEKITCDLDALHFSGHLFAFERNLVHLGREFGDLIEMTSEASQTDSSFLELTIVKNEHEFVRIAFNPKRGSIG